MYESRGVTPRKNKKRKEETSNPSFKDSRVNSNATSLSLRVSSIRQMAAGDMEYIDQVRNR